MPSISLAQDERFAWQLSFYAVPDYKYLPFDTRIRICWVWLLLVKQELRVSHGSVRHFLVLHTGFPWGKMTHRASFTLVTSNIWNKETERFSCHTISIRDSAEEEEEEEGVELATQPKCADDLVSVYRWSSQALLAQRAKPGCSEISPTVLTLKAVS